MALFCSVQEEAGTVYLKADFLEGKGKPAEEIDGIRRRNDLDLELREII